MEQTVSDVEVRGNLEMAAAVLAGLKLSPEIIQQVMRSRAMRESTFYQAVLQEGREESREEFLQKGEKRGIRKGYIRLLRQLVPLFEGVGVPMEPWLKRLGVTKAELEAAELED